MPISDLLGVRRGQAWLVALVILLAAGPVRADSTLSVGGFTLLNKGLVGVGRIPADLRDKFGETFGSGSGMAVDAKSWSRNGAAYAGTIYLLPDRGYNVTGTIDYRSRLNKLSVVLTPADDPASLAPEARQRTVQATLADTIMLVDRAGQNLSGLDPVAGGIRPAGAGLPPMPQAPNG